MSGLDWIILLILAASVFRSLMRGLVEEVFSLAAWIVAFIAAKWGAVVVGPILPLGVESESMHYFAGFAVVFLAMMILVFITGHMVKGTVEAVGLTGADKLIGGVFGLLRGLVILVGLTLAAGLTQLPKTDFWRHSSLSHALEIMAIQVKPLLPKKLSKYISFR
ncbi:MAG: CvpA family protein [Thiobacillaceae bacterium]|jgi:membrane protein required for colicin V production